MTRPAHLSDGDYQDLLRSGLTVETILAAQIYTMSQAEASDALGYGVGSAMAIPYLRNGRPPTEGAGVVRLKLHHAGADGKRYRTRTGSRNHLYIPPMVTPAMLADVTLPLFVTEGEKKCLKAAQEGLCCVALAGVNCWRTKLAPTDAATVPLPELDEIPLAGRTVYIVFDADPKPTTIADVGRAEAGLAEELTRRGACVFALRLPLSEDGTKCGLDDFLVAESVEVLWAIEPVRLAGPAAEPAITSASLAEILAIDPEALRVHYVAEPYVPRNKLVTLSAKGGTGKSKVLQDFLLARASGGTWLGLAVEPGPALFWSGEQGRDEDFRVTQALCRGRGLADPTQCPHYFEVVYDPPLRFGDPRMVGYVMDRVRAHPGLVLGVDSLRRCFTGDENDSQVADAFFWDILVPLKLAGATLVLAAHPPKTSGANKRIEDENYIRGSGDFVNQVDSFMVLRTVSRTRLDHSREDITLRLTHPKIRNGWQAEPRVVTLHVTEDRTARVTFTLDSIMAPAPTAAPASEETSGAVTAAALFFETARRANRSALLDYLAGKAYGRPAAEAALETLLAQGVIRGPLNKTERRKDEGRGHWFAFVTPLSPPVDHAADGADAPDDPDEPDLDC